MGLTQGYYTMHSVNRSFILDWFEWDCLRLENVNVVTQQTQSSHTHTHRICHQILKNKQCKHFLKTILSIVNWLISRVKIHVQRKSISFIFQCYQYNDDIPYSISQTFRQSTK